MSVIQASKTISSSDVVNAGKNVTIEPKTLSDEFWFTNKSCEQLLIIAKSKLIDHVSGNDIDDTVQDLRNSQARLNAIYDEMRYKSVVAPEIRVTLDRTHEHISLVISKLIKKSLGHFSSKNSECQSKSSSLSKSSTLSRRAILAAQMAALRIEQEAKKAEIQTKLEINKLELELEYKRQELESQRISTEIQKNQAEMNEMDKIEGATASYLYGDLETIVKNPVPIANKPEIVQLVRNHQINLENGEQQPGRNPIPAVNNPELVQQVKDQHINLENEEQKPRIENLSSSDDDLIRVMKTFAESVNLSRLPAPEPLIFSGDPLKYSTWKASFKALITSRGVIASERIYYLSKYLAGEAREIIENTFYLDSSEAYEQPFSMLEKRYGNSFAVSEAFRLKLHSWPKIASRDNIALRKFADLLRQCEIAMSQIQGLNILNDCHENRKLLSKLPEWLVQRWSRVVADCQDNEGTFPKFCTFSKFIQREADIACNPIISTLNTNFENVQGRSKAKVLSTSTKENQIEPCFLCKKQNHDLQTCYIFQKQEPRERRSFLMKNGLCFACLGHGHRSRDCKRKSICSKCKRKHPTCLHGDYEALHLGNERAEIRPLNARTKDSISHRLYQKDQDSKTSMIIPVYLSSTDLPKEEVLVYALLDTQSDTTFILQEIGEKLKANSAPTKLKLSTMTSTSVIDCHRFSSLQIRGIHSHERISLPTTYSREFIPVNRSHIPTSETALNWPHLSRLATEIPSLLPCKVGLLIGYDCPEALAPQDFIVGSPKEPFAQKTKLGWSLCGRSSAEETVAFTHRITTCQIPEDICISNDRTEVKFIHRTKTKEVENSEILKCLERDFVDTESDDTKIMSQNDIKFLEILSEGIHKDNEGYYEMPLPFVNGRPNLSNNKTVALKRLDQLKRRLQANEQYFNHYKTFMDEIIRRGDVEKVNGNLDTEDKPVWYIPHHGVYHPKKPNKVRVVFDCSAKYNGLSLNDFLLQGPDLLNSLVGVLYRFREDPIAIMGDIEKMFHQFRVESKDRDYLRFLWWEDGDLEKVPTIYRLKVHLFGASSSPGCANFALKKLAEKGREKFSKEACDFVQHNFYVDDGLTSCATEAEAIKLIKDTQELCRSGNIRFHKLLSNNINVLKSIPETERAKSDVNLDLNRFFENASIERALGTQWLIETDVFSYQITLPERQLTRRGILSTVASVYDPLGCLAPILLLGKQILQDTCRLKLNWDDPLPPVLENKWKLWLSDVTNLCQLKIPRCYKPVNFGKVIQREIHCFSDASITGLGACAYLRQVDEIGNVHCSLITAKARVCPLKTITLPRLELTAAVISAKLGQNLQREMKAFDYTYYWTDSKIVLGYLNNKDKRFHMFVTNRVQQILKITKPDQWNFIPTDHNPADHASRGLHSKDLTSSNWLTGPKFLWETTINIERLNFQINESDPEIKAEKHVCKTVLEPLEETNPLLRRVEKFSSWKRAVTAVTILERYVRKWKGDSELSPIEERLNAEITILKAAQSKEFEDILSGKSKLNGRLLKLDPFIDEKGLLRVGGRSKHSNLNLEIKHPIILPRHNHVTELIIKCCHNEIAHQGRGFTMQNIRANGYWIIGLSKAVSSVIYNCVTCRKLRGKLQTQKMSDLPEERVEPSPPFTHVGIDCFGPFITKDGRKEQKRHGLIVTCMASRALHIEVLPDLSTDSFINSLRCVIAIRGKITTIRCDHGSNFIGAMSEFEVALKKLESTEFKNFLIENKCEFLLNAPSSSHTGGCWERHIRTIRNVLTAMLQQHGRRLNTQSLRTFLYEAMYIINCRPLAIDDLCDPTSYIPISPNHLLTMKSSVAPPPPGDFGYEEIYANKWWRKVQVLANEFWSRWRKAYLCNIQIRQKWSTTQPSMQVGDIVILKEDNPIRGYMRTAKIVETFPDKDGLVRKVKILIGDKNLSDQGLRLSKPSFLERPIHKLVLLYRKNNE